MVPLTQLYPSVRKTFATSRSSVSALSSLSIVPPPGVWPTYQLNVLMSEAAGVTRLDSGNCAKTCDGARPENRVASSEGDSE
jgi:hypothetical protein